MASRNLFGSARITYQPPGETPVIHVLGAPLVELEPIDVRARFEWWSEDGTNREVVTVGDGVRDLIGTIRFDDQPDELKRMLRHGLNDDVILEYQKTLGGTVFPVKLVTVAGAGAGEVKIQRDRDRGALGEWSVRVHLRRVDGGSLDALFPGGIS